jgi:formylmethanofuran dehydrogenase subunit E
MVEKLDEELKNIEKFHGHLGPYVVVGYRMGKIANKKLGSDPFSKKVLVYTGKIPPLSCLIDGIQISSGCTIGKGNLEVKNENQAKAIFSKNSGKGIEITLKEEIKQEIDTNVTEENLVKISEKIFKKTDNELFKIK